MKIKVYLILFLLFCIHFIQAQSITGVIKDSVTGNLLPFVNMALLKSVVGCSSKENGAFELNIDKKNFEDTLVISAIGYFKKYIPIKTILGINRTILLQPNVYQLSEVVIKPTNKIFKKTYYKLGLFKKYGNFGKVLSVGYQEAIYIENKIKKQGIIESIIVKLEKVDILEKFPNVDFRIRIYSYDKKNNLPGIDLLLENVISKTKGGICTIDVKKYNINFPLDGIVIGMEYLDSEDKTKGENIIVGPRISYSSSNEKLIAWSSFFNRYWMDSSHFLVAGGGYYYPIMGIKISVEEEK